MKKSLIILPLFLISCGISNKNVAENDTVSISETNQIVVSDTLQQTTDCLIGNKLPPLNDSVINHYDYKFEFETFDSLTYQYESIIFKIEIEKFKEEYPGDFHLIKISSNDKQVIFFNPDGWVAKREYIDDIPSLSKYNLTSKNYVSVRQFSSNDILLFIFGYPYGSNPSLLTIINLTRFDYPQLIFNENYDLFDIKDYNNDNLLDIEVSKYFKYMKTDEDGNLLDKNKTAEKYFLQNGYFVKLK
jgi:hypothetical protein